MLITMLLTVGGVMVLVLILLAVVVAGIKQEPSAEELTSRPPSLVSALVRRLLGVYVRKPGQPPAPDQDHGEPCLTTWDPRRWPQGPAE